MLVTGTGTEVGKTWVAAGALGVLRSEGLTVAARKPAQSFAGLAGLAGSAGAAEPTDAERLAAVTGEEIDVVCPPHRSYPIAMAPPMAALRLGFAPPTIAQLAAEVTGSWPDPSPAIGVVEGAGGVAAPQADDGDTTDLAVALDPDLVVIVADAGLGTINHVRLAVGAMRSWRVVVYLNRFEVDGDLHQANRDWLVDRDGYLVVTELSDLAAVMKV